MTERRTAAVLVLAACLLASGCGSRSGLLPGGGGAGEPCGDAGATRPCQTICGSGTESCVEGLWQNCSAPQPKPPALVGTLRDFRDDHPDFETGFGSDPGIVRTLLGPDDKPVYAGTPITPTTSGQANFDQWYRDVPGVNRSRAHTIELSGPSGAKGTYSFSDSSFFPLDGELFGNQGRSHNYHFTFEVNTAFTYRGGEVFRFTGDDDFWVFINRRLAIDLGGVHGPTAASVDLDTQSATLGITAGQTYPLHLFFAERHTTQSSFRVETTIAEFQLCDSTE